MILVCSHNQKSLQDSWSVNNAECDGPARWSQYPRLSVQTRANKYIRRWASPSDAIRTLVTLPQYIFTQCENNRVPFGLKEKQLYLKSK